MRTHVLSSTDWEKVDISNAWDITISSDSDITLSNSPVDLLSKNATLPAWISIKIYWRDYIWVKWVAWTVISLFN